MTNQYQQTSINVPRPARFVDQSNFDVTIAGTPMVSLNTDATFVLLAGVAGPPIAYDVLLPNVQEVQGYFFFFRNASGAPVTVNARAGQVINGLPTLAIAPTDVAIIVSDPVNHNTTPPTLPVGWTLIKNGPA